MDDRTWNGLHLPQLLAHLRARMTPRQLRLFACACVRRLPAASRGTSLQAIELAERFADGQGTAHQLAAARFAGRFQPGHAAWAVCWPPEADDWSLMERALAWAIGHTTGSAHLVHFRLADSEQAALLRDLVGNPFARRPPVDPAWLAWNGGTVVQLARALYDEGAFDQLPILADAVEEAGGTGPLLDHLRGPGPHVRGCWAVDALLWPT